jgi:enoyl-CoA hydratase
VTGANGSAEAGVRLTVDEAVAELTFCRPPVNQLSRELLEDINRALDAIPDEARAVAVTSEVPRVFMAGGDIDFLRDGSTEELGEYVRLVQSTITRFERMPQPAVAGIDGAALGGGMELALACDIRVVSDEASLGQPEVKIGVLAGAGGTQRLVRAIGQGVARDLLLTGRSVSGPEAITIGLASRLAPPGEAGAAARELAGELAAGATEAIQATKRLAVAASDNSIDDGLEQEWEGWMRSRASDNAREGLSAFLEKREPSFN